MRSITFSEKVKQSGEVYRLLQQATQQLEAEAGRSRPLISAEWDLKVDNGAQPVVTLTLSDFSGSVHDDLSLEELRSPALARSRLRWLVGDLLEVRSHKLLDELLESSAEGGHG
jgi:hypothetical protein